MPAHNGEGTLDYVAKTHLEEDPMDAIKILILGSCVNRDTLNYDIDGHFELVGYFARSSFASAFSTPAITDTYTQNLSSKFQAGVVNADLEKVLQDKLEALNFDILFIDLIDERFKLCVREDGSTCTISNELIATGFNPESDSNRIVKPNTEEFYNLWERGWSVFFDKVKRSNLEHKIFINETYWAQETSDGNSFSPAFSDDQIIAANHMLSRLYKRIAADISGTQFIIPDEQYVIGAEQHRWGRSPFHYVDDYYLFMLKSLRDRFLKNMNDSICPPNNTAIKNLPDRKIESYKLFSNTCTESSTSPLELSSFSGNARSERDGAFTNFVFTGSAGTYQLRFKLRTRFHGNGLSIRFKTSEWQKLNYIGIGYTHENKYRHIKVVNAARDQWVEVSIGHGDLAFGIQNNWETPDAADIQEIKIYFKGQPLEQGSTFSIESIACWKESIEPPKWLEVESNIPRLPEALVTSLYSYLKKCFKFSSKQAQQYLTEGTCPLYGNISLDWPVTSTLPSELESVGTYRFSWHSLHPAIILMLHAKDEDSMAALFAARELVSGWLDRSYFNNDEDRKFAWYDHGTAERLLAFLLMWDIGAHHSFDKRFMSRLRLVIFKHAQLLASEMFYASHQVSRYHNHAWFQDMALIAAALAMPDFPCAQSWREIALSRLTDQLDRLIVRDEGYAVFVENSIGYHQGVQRLVAFAGELARLSNQDSTIPDVAEELIKFSDFLRYPDGRSPAQGDTFRRGNPAIDQLRHGIAYAESSVTILSNAGYAVVKSNHEQTPYMLSMFATSLCKTHKHEDNLSFTLFFDGIEWLIDPSFYSHEYAKPVQHFLRSSLAHSNVAILDVPYSIEPGHANLKGEKTAETFKFFGTHSSYKHHIVSREIKGTLTTLDFVISDSVQSLNGVSNNKIFSLFHCGEGVQVNSHAEGVTLSHPGSRYKLEIVSSLPASLRSGWDDNHVLQGICGHGFMEQTDTTLVAFALPLDTRSDFHITVKL